MIRIWCVSLAVLLVASTGCSGRSLPPSSTEQVAAESEAADRIPAADRPPISLLQVGESARELFDAAWSSDWPRCAVALQSLNEAASDLPDDLPRPDLVAKLHSSFVGVTEATDTKQRIDTMDAANAMTQIVDELSAQYRPVVPYDVKMLGYYGRQIELGIASGRLEDSTRATSSLVTVWNRVQPTIGRRGHVDDARRFDDLVVALMSARRLDDFVAPVGAELAAVSRLEHIFTSPQ